MEFDKELYEQYREIDLNLKREHLRAVSKNLKDTIATIEEGLHLWYVDTSQLLLSLHHSLQINLAAVDKLAE